MAPPTEDAMSQCASCGKGGDSLKTCTACKLVKYCSIDCQRAHRPKHKKECKRRAAALRDEELFKQPPSREECPICFLELPLRADMSTYIGCCGKIICSGCNYASAQQLEDAPCPFCRKPAARSNEEARKRIAMRVELNDPEAIAIMGDSYLEFERDFGKGLDLLQRAAELGSIDAHFNLGHHVDKEKAKYHYEKAATAGHVEARYNLGALEWADGNEDRAMKHFTISASVGDDDSLKAVQDGYRNGLVTKDNFEVTLRAHKKSQDEMKSEWRDKAAQLLKLKS